MNTFLFICLALCGTFAEGDLGAILKSPKKALKLYQDFKKQQGRAFGLGDDRMRLRLFVHNAEEVVAFNEQDESAKFELNFFSDLSESEKQGYLGLNITGHEDEPAPISAAAPNSLGAVPTATLWVTKGKVTAVKDQGMCESGWTFAAVGGLETRYAIASGRLRNFAEQEYLDCVNDGKLDGCNGGWPSSCYAWSASQGGRLSATADFSYKSTWGKCRSSSTADSMIAAKIMGYQAVEQTEAAHVAALAEGSLSVVVEVTHKFQQYKSGILKDNSCLSMPNHAVAAVGYTPEYILVKNSWGSVWGESGFVKMARNHRNCGLYEDSSYPVLELTGVEDAGGDDAVTDYVPDGDVVPTEGEMCKDDKKNCKSGKKCRRNKYKNKCKLTCGLCSG